MEQRWSEEGRAKDNDGKAHMEIVKVWGRALFSQDSNAVDFSFPFCFCHGFPKNQNYSIISLPNQIWLLLHQIFKKYQSLSN